MKRFPWKIRGVAPFKYWVFAEPNTLIGDRWCTCLGCVKMMRSYELLMRRAKAGAR